MKTSFSTNMIFLQGNISTDPESKQSDSGTLILKFSVATNHSVKVGENYETRTTFHRVVCIGKGAEWLESRLKKGHKVLVVGRQENRSYETADGTKKYISEVIADQVTPLFSSKDNAYEDVADEIPI